MNGNARWNIVGIVFFFRSIFLRNECDHLWKFQCNKIKWAMVSEKGCRVIQTWNGASFMHCSTVCRDVEIHFKPWDRWKSSNFVPFCWKNVVENLHSPFPMLTTDFRFAHMFFEVFCAIWKINSEFAMMQKLIKKNWWKTHKKAFRSLSSWFILVSIGYYRLLISESKIWIRIQLKYLHRLHKTN